MLEAAVAQSRHPMIDHVVIITRRFREDDLPVEHNLASEYVCENVTIERIATNSERYLEKEALAAELPSFTENLLTYLGRLPKLPDIIHAHFADAAEIADVVRRRFSIPFFYTPHALAIDKRKQGIDSEGLDGRIAAERQAIAAADGIIVSTHDEVDRQVRSYGVQVDGRIFRIAPGVPQRPRAVSATTVVNAFDVAFARPHLPIILAVARPVAKKNLIALVNAYAGDPTLQANANLVILAGQGDGRSSGEEQKVREDLRQRCADIALRGRVLLPPRHEAADVSALYRRAAQGGVFVNPALHEPFGLTLIEAAEAGVPVVATCHGGPTEIIATIGHGLLVDPRDETAIAAACRAVICDQANHARLQAAANANYGQYDWVRFADDTVAAYYSKLRSPALLVCDIDQTLTGCVAGAAAFAQWRRECGMPFIVATGRSFDEAQVVLAQWDLPEPDAFVTDVGTRIIQKEADGSWHSCGNWAAALDENWNRDAVAAALAPLTLLPQPAQTAGPHKLSFFGTAQAAAQVRERLALSGLAAKVVFSHGRLIDVLAPSAGKAAAVSAYAATLGMTLSQCVAAGDSGNDEDMLERCGGAIVVGNAGDELAGLTQRRGLYRATHHHAAGVLEGLAWFGLAESKPIGLGLVDVSLAAAA